MNKITPQDSLVQSGSMTRVKSSTQQLLKTSDVMQHDSEHVVKTANNFASEVMQHDLQSLATDASALADMLRNPILRA